MLDKQCIAAPLRRDKKRDFAFASGDDLLKSKIIQVLATEGEMPWRTSFGSGLGRLRHQKNDDELSALAIVHVRDALRKWVPEVEVSDVQTRGDREKLYLEVRYRVSDDRGAGGFLNVEL